MLLLGDLDSADYKLIKKECEGKIIRLEAELQEIQAIVNPKLNLPPIVEKAVFNLTNIDFIFKKANIDKKREIIGSIFHEKLCFDGTEHRTGKCNEAASLIFMINNKLQGKKNGAKSIFKTLPHEG